MTEKKCYQVTQLLTDSDGTRYRVFVDSVFATSRHDAICQICEDYNLPYETLKASLADAEVM